MALRDTETGETIATNVSWNDLLAAVAENNRKYFEQIEKQEMDNKNCEGCLYWTGIHSLMTSMEIGYAPAIKVWNELIELLEDDD